MSRNTFEEYYDENANRFVEELQTLIRFPSVGSVPAHLEDCTKCARWLKQHLDQMGFKVEFLEVPNVPPMVFAEHFVGKDKPTVLLYGHYDVQPPGDEQLWTRHPFEPVVQDGRIYGRGARDNKGQFFFSLKAYEALLHKGQLNCNVKILLDGQEESGSLEIIPHIPAWKDKLSCDVLMSSETQGLPDGTPSIMLGFRGLAYMRVNVHGACRPIHSGHYGGIVRNPAVELSKLVAKMFNDDGTIALPNFYDDVILPTKEERELFARVPFNEEDYFKELDIDSFMGSPEYTPRERVSFFPVIEFPGICGGYVGRAVRSSIPNLAQLKLTLRCARGQDPQRCLDIIEKHFVDNAPKGVRLEIEVRGVVCKALYTQVDSKFIALARTSLSELFGDGVGTEWNGATIPAMSKIRDVVGCETLLVGFGQLMDGEHGPNESFGLSQFKKGFLYTCDYLAKLSA